ncbi:MAG: Ntr family two-component system sensory/regulatory protein, partial [uncultured bacterium]
TFLQQNQEEIVDHLEVEIRNLRKSERDLQVKILELENKNKELHETQKMLVHSEKLAMAGQLVAGVVHEIRTPLTGMMGYHHILKMKLKDEILLGYLENCVNAENKIKDIVSNMLNFAKRKNDLVGIINIQDVFSSIKGIIHILSKQESVKIELQIPETELNIACNPGGVEQVVMSLVNNAVYAVKKTELNKVMNPPIMISAHKDEAKKEIVIKVQDKGCGIHDEIQEKIFEPFFTTKSLEDGTGLGLSICKTIVESFHGRMELHSKINVGSTFYVVFPEARKQNGI